MIRLTRTMRGEGIRLLERTRAVAVRRESAGIALDVESEDGAETLAGEAKSAIAG